MDDDIPGAWRKRAACIGLNDLFVATGRGRTSYREGRAICEPCPVRVDCLAYAVEHDIQLGLWGGRSPRQRRQRRREFDAEAAAEQVGSLSA